MKKFIFGFFLLSFGFVTVSKAGNWYINADSSKPAGNGQSWNSPWKSPSNVNWASVQPGDTIWIAGGSYSSGFKTFKNGNSSAWIYIKRVTSNDTVAVSAAGWSAGYDSQVVITAATGFWFDTQNTGSYLFVDGQKPDGIRVNFPANSFGSCAVFFSVGGMHDIVFRNMDMAGPGGATPYNYVGDASVIGLRPDSSTGVIYNFTVADSKLHGCVNLIYNLSENHDFLFLRCKFYDNGSDNGSIHANMNYTPGGNYDWSFVNCEFTNWQIEGINLYSQPNNTHYVIGSVFHDVMEGDAHCFWLGSTGGSTAQGPLHLYNNTFVGMPITTSEDRSSPFHGNSVVRNNIFWNAGFSGTSPIPVTANYNFSGGSTPGDNSISSGSNPFGSNYELTSAVGAKLPRDKGFDLSSMPVFAMPKNPVFLVPDFPEIARMDRNGNIRGADGKWDMGAYEFSGVVTPVEGACGPAINSCSSGILTDLSDTATHFQWRCDGYNGGNNSPTCSVAKPTPPNVPATTINTTGGPIEFNLTEAGTYKIIGSVNAPDNSSNSFYVDIDPAGPVDVDTKIWDIVSLTSGYQDREISWRGTGTFDNPQLGPKTFDLAAGIHTLYVNDRPEEGGTLIQSVRFVKVTSGSTPHPADTNSDFLMALNEATSFGACWKTNCAPNATLDNAVRAGTLWNATSDGRYQYNPAAACPLCWEVKP